MTHDFKKGDVVRLKSGGPRMTVAELGEGAIHGQSLVSCTWFDERNNPHSQAFDPDVLEIAPPRSSTVKVVRR
jgi:uncharacterized protein YodC (DUF2158 family)